MLADSHTCRQPSLHACGCFQCSTMHVKEERDGLFAVLKDGDIIGKAAAAAAVAAAGEHIPC